MQLSEVQFENQPPVDSYGPGFFRVMDEVRKGALLLGPDGVLPWSGLEDQAPLLALAETVDILFLGMGSEIAPVPADLRVGLEDNGLAVEPMSSPSACRTYNVLLSEGRRVAVAALPIA